MGTKTVIEAIKYLRITSDNCLEMTGAASAGLPGLTVGVQTGGI